MTHQKCPVCIPAMMVLGFTVPQLLPVERTVQGEKLCRIMDDLHPS